MAEDDKVWVEGLDGPGPKEDKGGKGRGLGWLAAVVVGLVVGVAVYVTWLQPPAGPQATEYEVVSGDTLWRIAKAHGVTVDELKEWNALSSDDIDVGQVLLVYTGEDAPVASSKGGKRKRRSGGGRVQPTPQASADAALSMPAARPCLTLDDSQLEEQDMVASQGLDYSQTKAAMDAFLPMLGRCFGQEAVDGSVTFEITVGCDGRVQAVRSVGSSGLPGEILDCAQDTLRYAAFPAHDMPDGFTFAYPMTFQFGD